MNPWRLNTIVSSGTIVMPPPMPRSPARKPTIAPRTTKATISAGSIRSRGALGELHDVRPLRRIDGRDREPVTSLQDAHSRERGIRPQLRERNETGLLDELDVDVEPARCVLGGLGVEVRALAIELRRVGIGRRRYLADTRDAGLGAARVIEKRPVADLHMVAHEIARLIVAHAEPRRRTVLGPREVVDRELVGLVFHQPVAHGASDSIRVESLTVYPRAFYFDFALVARSALTLRRTGPQSGFPASAGSSSNLGSASNALRNSSRQDFSRPVTQVTKAKYLCGFAWSRFASNPRSSALCNCLAAVLYSPSS